MMAEKGTTRTAGNVVDEVRARNMEGYTACGTDCTSFAFNLQQQAATALVVTAMLEAHMNPT
jgi:hypothetical protein